MEPVDKNKEELEKNSPPRNDNYPPPKKKPGWLKISFSSSQEPSRVKKILHRRQPATVCEEAACPNRAECWGEGRATFMILGKTCTRGCGFCDVDSGGRPGHQPDEPDRVARAAKELGLDYVVITSVTRDDLADGGAAHWIKTIKAVRKYNPEVKLEVLVPDFRVSDEGLAGVIKTRPDVFGHNIETAPRLYSRLRPEASYKRSLAVLKRAASSGLTVKSGMMLGMGEREAEIESVFHDLKENGVEYLTLGQYLRPSARHWPVDRWVRPGEFSRLANFAREIGYEQVEAGPFVRSSYHAKEQFYNRSAPR